MAHLLHGKFSLHLFFYSVSNANCQSLTLPFIFQICINAWIFSIIFHCRDFPITELFDYGFAYSMVLSGFCCMILRYFASNKIKLCHLLKIKPSILFKIRMLYKSSTWLKSLIVACCTFFYINHLSYLAVGRFDYSYNMKANVITGNVTKWTFCGFHPPLYFIFISCTNVGIITGFGWLIWCFRERAKKPYARKMLIFQILASAAVLLELLDFAPIFWTFDAHSLWHLATVPLTILFYE